jgi:hypothetical protein
MKFGLRRNRDVRSSPPDAMGRPRSSAWLLRWNLIITVVSAILALLTIPEVRKIIKSDVRHVQRPPSYEDTVYLHAAGHAAFHIRGSDGAYFRVNLGIARVRYSAFDSISVGEPRFFSVSILPYQDSLGSSVPPPVIDLDEKEDQYAEADLVRTGSVMRAELAGSDFEIQRTGDTSDQPLTSSEPTVWAWTIEPEEVGVKELVLTLSVVVDVEGQRLPKVLRACLTIAQSELVAPILWAHEQTSLPNGSNGCAVGGDKAPAASRRAQAQA